MREAHMPDMPAPEAYATVQGLREQIGQKVNATVPVLPLQKTNIGRGLLYGFIAFF